MLLAAAGRVLGIQTECFRQAVVTCSFRATSSINGLVALVRSAARAPPGAGPPAGRYTIFIKTLSDRTEERIRRSLAS